MRHHYVSATGGLTLKDENLPIVVEIMDSAEKIGAAASHSRRDGTGRIDTLENVRVLQYRSGKN